ncbi:hypothetical protein FGB62_16g017 [Gracilaria domingensis]|nr:hypothetical protein FGB62_16g017 [Gracilaria domingensis]
MVSGAFAEWHTTPDRAIHASSSRDRLVPGIQPSITWCPSGIPKASSITRSPHAFHSDDGDFGLLDMFVDSKDFELHETVRSLRFTAAATNISNLFPPTPRSTITLPQSSISKSNPTEEENETKGVKAFADCPERVVEQMVESTTTRTEVQHLSEEATALTASTVKPLTPEALAKARLQLHAFIIEPVTPRAAEQNNASEPESRRPFSLSPRSRKVFEKLSIRRDKKKSPRQTERDTWRVDDDGPTTSGPQPLSKMVTGLERLFSRISSTSRPTEENGNFPFVDTPSSANNPTSQRKMKAMLAKWRGDVKKMLEKFVD